MIDRELELGGVPSDEVKTDDVGGVAPIELAAVPFFTIKTSSGTLKQEEIQIKVTIWTEERGKDINGMKG